VPPDITPPVPVAASLVWATLVLTVTWDQALVAQPTAANNWIAQAHPVGVPDRHVNPAPGASVGNQTTMTVAFTGPAAGVNRVRYLAAPPDIIGAGPGGLPAAAFANFPLAVV